MVRKGKQQKKIAKGSRIRFGFRSLAFRYSIFFILAVMLIFIVSFIYTLIYALQILANEAKNDTANTMDLTISRLEKTFQEVEEVPNVLARFVNTADPNYGEMQKVLQGIVLSEPYVYGTSMAFEPYAFRRDSLYYAIYSYQTESGIRTKFLGGESYDYFEKEWYKKAKEQGKPIWTEPYYDQGAGDTLMCTYSVPLFRDVGGKETFIGVITLDISLSAIGREISEIKVYETGYAFLVSGDGAILYHPDSALINQNIFLLAADTINPRFRSLAAYIKDSIEINRVIILGTTISTTKVALLPSTGWHLVVVFPVLEVFSDLINFLKYLGTIFLFSVLAVFVVTILITRRLTSPLRKLVKITHQIGHGDFDLELPRVKRRDEIGVLTRSFSVMLDQLKEHIRTLHKTISEKEKIESELNIAHTIQMGMLPREFPLRSEFELFAVLDSARAVGGDLYDFFFLDHDHMFISVGDVSGKGVPASLFMTVVRTLYRSRTMDGQPMHQIMALINQELCKDNPNVMFVTMVSGIINFRTGTIDLCNAGHNPPVIMDREGNVRRLNLFSAIPLGIQEYHGFRTEKVQLQPGDRLVLYTDGVTEAINVEEELFGEKRLIDVLHTHRSSDVPELVKEVVASIHDFSKGVEQADDITLLILGYQKSSAIQELPMETKIIRVPNQLDQLPMIVETVEEISRDWNISSKINMELNLVLEELFTNIVFYAFKDKQEHLIDITFSLTSSDILQIVIVDDGRYFDLIEASQEVKLDAALEERKVGGLGIHFVRQMMDEMNYERKGGKNVVTLKKYIK
ncbi:MAG: HAMP domain-containing protein [Bacteroidetes bacterium]|nr:MAG: HAMP domain-containing protein [Bacteroidota bacterium]